jgi:predicted TIM-barrel fold metal-dependent hydrolase
MPEVAALCRRLYFDTAAVPFIYQPTAYAQVIELCGADRLLFGSDHPLLHAQRYLRTLAELGLDSATYTAVTGGNAQSLLRLA